MHCIYCNKDYLVINTKLNNCCLLCFDILTEEEKNAAYDAGFDDGIDKIIEEYNL